MRKKKTKDDKKKKKSTCTILLVKKTETHTLPEEIKYDDDTEHLIRKQRRRKV